MILSNLLDKRTFKGCKDKPRLTFLLDQRIVAVKSRKACKESMIWTGNQKVYAAVVTLKGLGVAVGG